MKKILLFISELTYSGSPNSSLRLARALNKLGYYVEVWSYTDGPFRVEFDNYKIPIRIVGKNEIRNRDVIHNVKKFDLMIANSILTFEAYEGISTLIPSYWYIREAENIPYFFRWNYRCGYVLQQAQYIISVSEYAADYIRKYFNQNVQVLHNCVDDMYFEIQRTQKNDDKIKIIMIGSIEQRKNFSLLVDAFCSLPYSIRNHFELHLIGKPMQYALEYAEYIKKKAAENEDIFYYGEITDRTQLMNIIERMDVLAVVSNDESCSLTALEGAMMSKPLLLSQNIGAKYLVDDKNGWIIETDSKKAIQEAMTDILNRQKDLPKMGKESRNRYLSTSTFEIYCSNVESFLTNSNFHKFLYPQIHLKKRLIWYFDDTSKYFSYPQWGETNEERHIYSFDIFDTILTRDVASPIGIFVLIQKELCENKKYASISEYVKKNFIDLRIGAEDFARQVYCINGVEDKTFDQIYDALYCSGRLTFDEIEMIKKLEIALEIKHSVGIVENITRIKKLKSQKKHVILISDMYLSSDTIREMLVKEDNIFNDIPIYVSSECKCMKGTTTLFKYVHEKEKVNFSNWTHIGDNVNADINAPTKLGIKCERYTGVFFNEQDLEMIKKAEREYETQTFFGEKKVISVNFKPNENEFNVIFVNWLIKGFVENSIAILKDNGCKVVFALDFFGRFVYRFFYEIYIDSGIQFYYIPWGGWAKNSKSSETLRKLKYLVCKGELSLEELRRMFNLDDSLFKKYSLMTGSGSINNDDQNLAFNIISDPVFYDTFETWQRDMFQKSSKLAFIGFCKNSCNENDAFQLNRINRNKGIDLLYFSDIKEKSIVDETNNGNCYIKLNDSEQKVCENSIKSVLHDTNSNSALREKVQDYINQNNNCVSSPNGITRNHRFERTIMNYLVSRKIKPTYTPPEKNTQVLSICLDNLWIYPTASKDGLFQLIAYKISDNNCDMTFSNEFINSFVDIRKEAELIITELYRQKRIPRKDLKTVYKYIQKVFDLSDKEIRYLRRLEYKTIKEQFECIPENLFRIREAAYNNIQVVVIADSVYPQGFVKSVLTKMDSIFYIVNIYTTASTNQYFFDSKEYFGNIIKKIGIKQEHWYHVGSSVQFDINGSKAMGLRKELYNELKFTKYEEAALNEYKKVLPVQLMIGTARNNRLLYKGTSEQVIGNSLAGPMLYPYVQWVLDDAKKRGINTLLFVARDGYVLKQIADIIILIKGMNITTEYVYGSRKAWRMASYTADEDLSIFFKMAHIEQLSDIQSFSKIFGVPIDDLVAFFPTQYHDLNRKLDTNDYKILRNHLEMNNEFRLYVEERAKTERHKIEEYFYPYFENRRSAFVELSGTGATQNCLAKILEIITTDRIITYFLNLDGMDCRDNAIFLNYIPNKFWRSWIIENLCRAPHGQTDGYKYINGKVTPILADTEEEEALISHGYLKYVYGVMEFAQSFSQIDYLKKEDIENPILFQKYLKHLTHNPSLEIRMFIGDMPFETTGFNSHLSVYAPKLTDKQLRDIYLTRRNNEKIDKFYNGADLDFSLKRMTKEDIDKINYYKSSEGTKYGRNARIKRRLEEDGYISTLLFIVRRSVRTILLKIKIIKY